MVSNFPKVKSHEFQMFKPILCFVIKRPASLVLKYAIFAFFSEVFLCNINTIHEVCVRATAVGRGAERDAERNAVLAGDPKGLVYYVMIN